MLEENAIDFVNSLRGARFKNSRSDILNVSHIYDWHLDLFENNPEESVLKHIKKYASGKFGKDIQKAKAIRFSISDFFVADTVNGRPNHITRSRICMFPVVGIDPTCSEAGKPITEFIFSQDLLNKWRHQYRGAKGDVTIEDLEASADKPGQLN